MTPRMRSFAALALGLAVPGAASAGTTTGGTDYTPLPVISKVEKLPGFHLCTGFSGHGFGLGPGAGRLMAEIVTGERTCVDPTPFRYTRFFDGTQSGISNPVTLVVK